MSHSLVRGMHRVKVIERLLGKPRFAWGTGHMLIVPAVPRASQTDASLYHGTSYQCVTGTSLSPACYESHRPDKAWTQRVPPLLQPELFWDALTVLVLSQQAAWEGCAVAVSLPVPHRHERGAPRGALHCTS